MISITSDLELWQLRGFKAQSTISYFLQIMLLHVSIYFSTLVLKIHSAQHFNFDPFFNMVNISREVFLPLF